MIIALFSPLILLTLSNEMNLPSLMNLVGYSKIIISFSLLLLLGCFLRLSEGAVNLGCFIGTFVYAVFFTQDISEIIFIYGISSFIPLIFALFGFKLGLTVKAKFT